MTTVSEFSSHLPYRFTLEIPSLESLDAFARKLVSQIGPGDVIALNGSLGAGKTTLVQALARALNLREPIASPTFGLIHEYRTGSYPVIHADLYRLGPEKAYELSADLLPLIEEGNSLILVEWACYGKFLDSLLTVEIELSQTDVGSEAQNRCLTLWSQSIVSV